MNKICGYNCEHNKGGQCQIIYCDKIGEITTTTQWLSGGRQQGKTYQLIKKQQKEIERLNNIIYLIKNSIDITIQIIKEQPTGNDEWILERLNGIKNIGQELKEGK